MARHLIAVAIATLVVTFAGAAAQQASSEAELLAKARAIHDRVFTVDSHVDILGATYATPALDPGKPTRLKCDLPKMKAGGMDGVFLAVYTGQRQDFTPAGYKAVYAEAIDRFDAIDRLTAMHPGLCELARTPGDVERIEKTGKRVILVGVENGYPMGEDVATLKTFYDRGARYVTLVHGSHNQLADSSGDPKPRHDGLSALGKKAVAEMNRLGIIVDTSHASAKVFWDVIAMSKAPIMASHSGCTAVAKSDRNLDDDQLRALAKNGGVIQIVALGSYLKEDSPERAAAVRKLREELGRGRGGRGGRGAGGPPAAPPTPQEQAEREKMFEVYRQRMEEIDRQFPGATLEDFVNHIDHAVKVAGIDHVGIGTDFDGGGGVKGFNDHSEALNVTVELVRRGYTEEQIRKIWGGNLMRVWREVNRVAGK
ncbi:MAG TPA: dipeptidase [Vicinamibacterales bacterium]|nr:dipeptidase [Acidobacteriota bacterium]HOC17314.1 dipeptidase [Vicinamibacterales bacterium]